MDVFSNLFECFSSKYKKIQDDSKDTNLRNIVEWTPNNIYWNNLLETIGNNPNLLFESVKHLTDTRNSYSNKMILIYLNF